MVQVLRVQPERGLPSESRALQKEDSSRKKTIGMFGVAPVPPPLPWSRANQSLSPKISSANKAAAVGSMSWLTSIWF